MKTTYIVTALVVLVVIVVGGYVGTRPTPSPTPVQQAVQTPVTQTQTAQTVQTEQAPAPVIVPKSPESVNVSINNFAFSPSQISVKLGTKVTWTNNDKVAHTVTSDSGGLLNSLSLAPGKSFSFTFTKTGSVPYHCSVHPMMTGIVVVTN